MQNIVLPILRITKSPNWRLSEHFPGFTHATFLCLQKQKIKKISRENMSTKKTLTFVTGNAKKLEEFVAILGSNFKTFLITINIRVKIIFVLPI